MSDDGRISKSLPAKEFFEQEDITGLRNIIKVIKQDAKDDKVKQADPEEDE